MRCPKNKQCPKQQGYYLFDDRPICKKCDKKGKDKETKEATRILKLQKKINKRNDKLIYNIEKAHKAAGKSKLIFKEKK